jgi:hypothetical protein
LGGVAVFNGFCVLVNHSPRTWQLRQCVATASLGTVLTWAPPLADLLGDLADDVLELDQLALDRLADATAGDITVVDVKLKHRHQVTVQVVLHDLRHAVVVGATALQKPFSTLRT